MTRARIAAATAGIVTALLLQATLVGPLAGWVPISLAIASVSWISPPAPVSCASSARMTSGWRM